MKNFNYLISKFPVKKAGFQRRDSDGLIDGFWEALLLEECRQLHIPVAGFAQLLARTQGFRITVAWGRSLSAKPTNKSRNPASGALRHAPSNRGSFTTHPAQSVPIPPLPLQLERRLGIELLREDCRLLEPFSKHVTSRSPSVENHLRS